MVDPALNPALPVLRRRRGVGKVVGEVEQPGDGEASFLEACQQHMVLVQELVDECHAQGHTQTQAPNLSELAWVQGLHVERGELDWPSSTFTGGFLVQCPAGGRKRALLANWLQALVQRCTLAQAQTPLAGTGVSSSSASMGSGATGGGGTSCGVSW